jgi:hypothetical protein
MKKLTDFINAKRTKKEDRDYWINRIIKEIVPIIAEKKRWENVDNLDKKFLSHQIENIQLFFHPLFTKLSPYTRDFILNAPGSAEEKKQGLKLTNPMNLLDIHVEGKGKVFSVWWNEDITEVVLFNRGDWLLSLFP